MSLPEASFVEWEDPQIQLDPVPDADYGCGLGIGFIGSRAPALRKSTLGIHSGRPDSKARLQRFRLILEFVRVDGSIRTRLRGLLRQRLDTNVEENLRQGGRL